MSIKDYTKDEAAKEFGIYYKVRLADYFYKWLINAGPVRFFECAKTMPIDNVIEIEEALGHAKHQMDSHDACFESLEEAKTFAIEEKKKNYATFLSRLYDYARDEVVQDIVARVRKGEETNEKLVQFTADYERTMAQFPQLQHIVRLMKDTRGFNYEYDVQLDEAPEKLSVWFNIAAHVGDEVYIADIADDITESTIRKVKITDLVIQKPLDIRGLDHPENKAYSFNAWFSPHNGVDEDAHALSAEKHPFISGESAFTVASAVTAEDRKFGALGFIMGEAPKKDSFGKEVLSIPFNSEEGAKAYLLDMAKDNTSVHRKRGKELAAKLKL